MGRLSRLRFVTARLKWTCLICPALMWSFPASGSGAHGAHLPFIYTPSQLSISAPEARQGVASDGLYLYAIDNSTIGKYRIADGELIARFEGSDADFPHLNSCAVVAGELACAASNYPATPHRGTVEYFRLGDLAHLRTQELPENPGSLTVFGDGPAGRWAVFANYDGKGGVAGQDHTATIYAELGSDYRVARSWRLPATVLSRLAPYSVSGADWSDGKRLFVSGHDKPEIYVLTLPEAGDVLRHIATIATPTRGQAIDLDPDRHLFLWAIDRKSRTIAGMQLPEPETGR